MSSKCSCCIHNLYIDQSHFLPDHVIVLSSCLQCNYYDLSCNLWNVHALCLRIINFCRNFIYFIDTSYWTDKLYIISLQKSVYYYIVISKINDYIYMRSLLLVIEQLSVALTRHWVITVQILGIHFFLLLNLRLYVEFCVLYIIMHQLSTVM